MTAMASPLIGGMPRQGKALRPPCPCPDHPGEFLIPLPGGGARGTCPADSRSYQMTTPEVKP